MFRKIKGLDDAISVSFVDWVKTEELSGWGFSDKVCYEYKGV